VGVEQWSTQDHPPFPDIQSEFEIRSNNSQGQPKIATKGDKKTTATTNTESPHSLAHPQNMSGYDTNTSTTKKRKQVSNTHIPTQVTIESGSERDPSPSL
jgi:hypothetical protein